MITLREQFLAEVALLRDTPRLLVTAVLLPSGAIETINNTDQLLPKIDYLVSAYDDEFRLKTNPDVRVVGYMMVVLPIEMPECPTCGKRDRVIDSPNKPVKYLCVRCDHVFDRLRAKVAFEVKLP